MNKEFKVKLDINHPGFNDPKYREQRDQIAKKAKEFNIQFSKKPDLSLIPVIQYTQKQHELWNFLFKKLETEIQKNAHSEIVQAFAKLNLDRFQIPNLKTINQKLQINKQPIQVIPTDGHVEQNLFFENLAKGFHFSTQYIRHTNQPEFTPEPDIVHDILGHIPTYFINKITQTAILMGKAAKNANKELLEQLDRIFWFSFEYGLCKQNNQIKAYGAGNLSSLSDIKRCVDPNQVTHKKFNIRTIINTPYDPTQANKVLFVAESIEDAMNQIQEFLKQI